MDAALVTLLVGLGFMVVVVICAIFATEPEPQVEIVNIDLTPTVELDPIVEVNQDAEFLLKVKEIQAIGESVAELKKREDLQLLVTEIKDRVLAVASIGRSEFQLRYYGFKYATLFFKLHYCDMQETSRSMLAEDGILLTGYKTKYAQDAIYIISW